jgi:hypothetical protein
MILMILHQISAASIFLFFNLVPSAAPAFFEDCFSFPVFGLNRPIFAVPPAADRGFRRGGARLARRRDFDDFGKRFRRPLALAQPEPRRRLGER